MAGHDLVYQAAALKAATSRLVYTPINQLPSVIPSICAQLATCKDVLSLERDATVKSGAELSTSIHKFKARIGSLLQDRTPHARWAGAVLAKTAIENGNFVVLQDCLPWMRALLGTLSNQDPSTTKRLCIITLTRMFILTRENQSLVREITTPNLPAFVASCIRILGVTRELAHTVFEAFSRLISRHPTIFRSYTSQLRPIVLRYVSTDVSQLQCTEATVQSARRLLIQLHVCAPKNMAAAEWTAGLRQTITCAHEDLDQVFRSILEDWESTTGYRPIQHSLQALSTEPGRPEKDVLGLEPWIGMRQGSSRIVGLLGLIRSYIATPTAFAASVDVGAVLDLLKRVLASVRPSYPREWEANGRADTRFDRKEREDLALVLPDIHIAAVRAVQVLLRRFGQSSPALATSFVEPLAWTLEVEKSEAGLREALYEALTEILCCVGTSLGKTDVALLARATACCCEDLLATSATSRTLLIPTEGKMNGINTDLSKPQGPAPMTESRPEVFAAAYKLLPAFLKFSPAGLVPRRARAEMDRVALLTRHKAAILASVQNPSIYQQSLLPFLSRLFPEDNDVLRLLKPRMPVILHLVAAVEDEDGEPEEDEATELDPSNGHLRQEDSPDADSTFAIPHQNMSHWVPVDRTAEPQSVRLEGSAQTQRVGRVNALATEDVQSNKRSPNTALSSTETKRARMDESSMMSTEANPQTVSSQSDAQRPVESETASQVESANINKVLDQAHSAPSGPQVPRMAAQSVSSEPRGLEEDDDSDDDDDDFEMPQLHFRSESDDDEEEQ